MICTFLTPLLYFTPACKISPFVVRFHPSLQADYTRVLRLPAGHWFHHMWKGSFNTVIGHLQYTNIKHHINVMSLYWTIQRRYFLAECSVGNICMDCILRSVIWIFSSWRSWTFCFSEHPDECKLHITSCTSCAHFITFE